MVSTLGAEPALCRLLFYQVIMDTYVYIDGFNFYYGAVKNTKFKWLDLEKLFTILLGNKHNILKIKYYTALVSGKLDPTQPLRQKTYLRALQVQCPKIEIVYGSFLSHVVTMPLATPRPPLYREKVIKTEEKGSDVNIAVHILNDAWENRYQCAVLVSNDSDLAEPLRLVKEERKKLVGVVNPQQKHPSKTLISNSHFQKNIRQNLLSSCLMPDNIPNTNIHIPYEWK